MSTSIFQVDSILTTPDLHFLDFLGGQEPLLGQVPEVIEPQSGAGVGSFSFKVRCTDSLGRPGSESLHLQSCQDIHFRLLFSSPWRVLLACSHFDRPCASESECS